MDSKPQKPDESECCNSGCNPCIFDVYEEQLRKWKLKQSTAQGSIALNESKYLPFVIEHINIIAPSIKLLEFRPVKLTDENNSDVLITNAKYGVDYEILDENLNLRAGHYLILKGQYEKINENNSVTTCKISRPYTPILQDCKGNCFKIIVALYPDGKMSQFLNKLSVNDVVFWRGPYKEFVYRINSFKKILLIGGGTGVIPLYNIAKEIVENNLEETLIKFLAAFKNVESLILREELNKLQDYWNFILSIYITNCEDSEFKLKYNEKLIFSKLNEDLMFSELSYYKQNECFIVICGPESFNNFVCKCLLKYGAIKENIYVFK